MASLKVSSAILIIILVLISISFTTVNSKGGGRGGGGSRGGGGIFGGRGKSSSSGGGGGWFGGKSKAGGMKPSSGGGWGRGGSKPWPQGSSSVNYGGRSMRIIPIPLFIPMGGFGYGGYGHGYGGYGHNSYARRTYREEDGFYPCPPEIVAQHKETLNKSIDDAIKSGSFNHLYLEMTGQLNGTMNASAPAMDSMAPATSGLLSDTSSTESTNSMVNPIVNGTGFKTNLTNDELIKQIQSAISNYTFMCYDESRDQSNNNDDGAGSVVGLVVVVILLGALCWCFFSRNAKDSRAMSYGQDTNECTPVNFQQRAPANAVLVTPRPSITPMTTGFNGAGVQPSAPMAVNGGVDANGVQRPIGFTVNDPPPSYEETVQKKNTNPFT